MYTQQVLHRICPGIPSFRITYSCKIFLLLFILSVICAGTSVCLRNSSRGITMKAERGLSVHNVNPNLLNIEYAVRGPLATRAEQIQHELDKVSHGQSIL